MEVHASQRARPQRGFIGAGGEMLSGKKGSIQSKKFFLIPEYQGAENHQHDTDQEDGDSNQSSDGIDNLGLKYPDRIPPKGT
jgi:hypothetical protein